jgi:adenylate cyclase
MAAKILVVDDELDLQKLIKRKFRREIRHGEFSFEFADDGVAALEMVEADESINLVISDINMPRMDGLTLLEHLARHCQTNLNGPAKGAGLRRSGRQLTPLG